MIENELRKKLSRYIEERFVENIQFDVEYSKGEYTQTQEKMVRRCKTSYSEAPTLSKGKISTVDSFIDLMKDKESFSQYLFLLIDESGKTDADIYNKAGIDRRLFSKIRSNKDYQPSKPTIFALALSLGLDYTKTSKLLRKAGYDFSNNKLTDIIVMFCIENGIYDLYKVDEILIEYNQKPIASL